LSRNSRIFEWAQRRLHAIHDRQQRRRWLVDRPSLEPLEQRILLSRTPIEVAPDVHAGSLVERGGVFQLFESPGETDEYSAEFDVFSSASVLVRPLDPTLQLQVTLADPGGGVLAQATAAAPGEAVMISPREITFSGAPAQIDVQSLAGTGFYEVRVLQDGVFEQEYLGPPNDSRATAEDITGSRLAFAPELPLSGDRLAVQGVAGPDGDYFLLPDFGRQFSTVAIASDSGGPVTVEIFDSAGNLVTLGGDGTTSASSAIPELFADVDGDLYAKVSSPGSVDYTLVVTEGIGLGLEPDRVNGQTQALSQFSQGYLGALGVESGGGGIRVAVLDSFFESQVVEQLNDSFLYNFNTNFVSPDQIDTRDELNNFDVVVIGGGDVTELGQVADPLRAWMEAGGGVVSTGEDLAWLASDFQEDPQTLADLDALIPAQIDSEFNDTIYGEGSDLELFQVNPFHPITASLPSPIIFEPTIEGDEDSYVFFDNGIDPTAETLAEFFSDPGLVIDEVGLGRTALLTVDYHHGYTTDQFDPDLLLEETVAWAGTRDDLTDAYLITAFQGDTVTVTVEQVRGDIIPTVRLLDSAGNEIAADLNPLSETTAEFTIQVNPATSVETYTIEVGSTSGSGVYAVDVNGDGVLTSPAVTSTNVDNETFGSFPRQIVVELSNTVDPASLQPGDVTINGIEPASVSVVDGNTLAFGLDIPATNTGDGTYTVNIDFGAFESANDLSFRSYSTTFDFVDAQPPRVQSITVEEGESVSPGRFDVTVELTEGVRQFVSSGFFGFIVLDFDVDVSLTNTLTGERFFTSPFNGIDVVGDPTNFDFITGFSLGYDGLDEGVYEFRMINTDETDGLLGDTSAWFDSDGNQLDGSPGVNLPSGDGAFPDDFVRTFFVDRVAGFELSPEALTPDGALVYRDTIAGAFHDETDEDSYSVNLAAGQRVSVILRPIGGDFRGKVDLKDPFGTVIASDVAPTSGLPIVVTSPPALADGSFEIDLSTLSGRGSYEIEVLIDAEPEGEEFTGDNDTIENAESLGGMITLPSGAERYAVRGEVGGDDDVYLLPLEEGQSASAMLGSLTGEAGFTIELINPAGDVVALSDGISPNVTQSIHDFVAPSAGDYALRVSGNGQYLLTVTKGASFDREINDGTDRAQDLSHTGNALGHLLDGPDRGTPGEGRPIRVVEVDTSNPPLNENALINQLNNDTHFDFEAVRVTVEQADTLAELLQYDVVIIGNEGTLDEVEFANALARFVELGGGLVAAGDTIRWVQNAFQQPTLDTLNPLVPIDLSRPYVEERSATVTALDGVDHPITANLDPFVATGVDSALTSQSIDEGATLLARIDDAPAVVVSEVGRSGRSVFLAVPYTTNSVNHTPIRSGGADRLIEQAVAWAGSSGDRADVYTFNAHVGDDLAAFTTTPAQNTANPLNPALRLLDPAGNLVAADLDSALDGVNASLAYTVPDGAAGTYTLIVETQDDHAGAYTVQLTGATGDSTIRPTVVDTSPAEAEQFSAAPTNIDLTFSEAIDVTTVQPADLMLSSGSVDSVEILDGRTVRFNVTIPDVEDVITYTLGGGSLTDLQGEGTVAYSGMFDIDTSGPRVVAQFPAQQAAAPFSQITLQFDENILRGSFTLEDVISFTGPSGQDLAGDLNEVTGFDDLFTISFDDQVELGQYNLVLGSQIRNVVGVPMDQNEDGINGGLGDTYTAAVTLETPDLEVETVSVTPTAGAFGESFDVTYTVRNVGTDTALEEWFDRIWLSTNDMLGGDISLTTVDTTFFSPLAPGESYSRTVTVNAPLRSDLAEGTYHLIVQTDHQNRQLESTETNNTLSDTVDLVVPALPDLIVEPITLPGTAASGSPLPLTWTITNQGTGDFTGTFADQVYLSTDDVFNGSGDQLLGTFGFTGTIPAGESVTRNFSPNVPITVEGSRNVIIRTDVYNNVFEHQNEANNLLISDTTINFTFPDLPDLVVEDVVIPGSAVSGELVPVTWTVRNQGPGAISGSFNDRVYLSTDAIVGGDQAMGNFQFTGTLAPGEAVTRTEFVEIPIELSDPRFIVIQTDSSNRVFEDDNEDNNTAVSDAPLNITLAPLPNLVVSQVIAPTEANSNQLIDIEWRVTNIGNASTQSPLWYDAVYFSTDPVFDASDTRLASVQNFSFLASGESYDNTATVRVPREAQGPFYFLVRTDWISNRVFELFNEGDNTSATPTATDVTLTPPPDLQVTNVVTPSQGFSGQPFTFNYTVTNTGSGDTLAESWIDRIWLSLDDELVPAEDTLLGSVGRFGVLEAGDSYDRQATVDLPIGISGPFFILVEADGRRDVFEFAFETNNTGVDDDPTQINLTPPPDLVTSMVDGPEFELASRTIDVTYRVTNEGATETVSNQWFDRLFLSTDDQLDPDTDLYLGRQLRRDTLAPGQFYEGGLSATLPDGLTGTFHIFVQTNYNGGEFEVDRDNNVASDPQILTVESRPADLVVPRVVAPASVQAGRAFQIEFDLLNQGQAGTVANQWRNRLYLSTDEFFGNADDQLLTSHRQSGSLDGGELETVEDFPVPLSLSVSPGNYHLFVVADTNDNIYEGAAEGNNASAALPIEVTRQTADLVVSDITPVPSATSGEPITVEWTVENQGGGATNAFYWFDEVWLSTDQTLGGDDIRLGSFQRTNMLGAGEAYTAEKTFGLPDDVEGDYFVLVRTDFLRNRVTEPGVEGNNLSAATDTTRITLAPTPDLVVQSVDAPATGFAGRSIEVSWTIENAGGQTVNSSRHDSVYVSRDQVFDRTSDKLLGSFQYFDALAPGETVTTSEFLRLPTGEAGPFYVFISTDSSDRVFERDAELNNTNHDTDAVSVDLPARADLVVGAVQIPADAEPGSTASITYTVQNQGVNTAFGEWEDSVYLSTDPVWDIEDAFFDKTTYSTNFRDGGTPITPGGSYTQTAFGELPGVLPGQYFVIVRSDIRNFLPESDEGNNIGASLDRFSLDVPELTTAAPVTGQFNPGRSLYYRIDVAADETLLLDLDSADDNAVNEVYVLFNNVPTRAQFDFRHEDALTADQRVLIPRTEEGTYYIQVYNATGDVNTDFSLTAELLQFDVIDDDFGQGGNIGDRTIEINGSRFDRTVQIELRNDAGETIPARDHWYDTETRMYATFDLVGATPGQYDLIATNAAGDQIVVEDSFEVLNLGFGEINHSPIGPQFVRALTNFRFTVAWGNDGLNDLPAPLLQLSGTTPFGIEPGLLNIDEYSFIGATQDDGPAGILRPGQTSSLPLFARAADNGGSVSFFFEHITADEDLFDWETVRDLLVPDGQTTEQFEGAFARMIENVGPTWADLRAMLARNATLVTPVDGSNRDLGTLINLERRQALAELTTSITGRIDAPNLGVAVRGQTVYATHEETGQVYQTSTLSDGSFIFELLQPGTYAFDYDQGLLVAPPTVTVAQDEAVTDVTLDVALGGVIEGEVFFGGELLVDATVDIYLDGGLVDRVITDAEGAFRRAGLVDGEYTLVVNGEGAARKIVSGLTVTADSFTRTDVVLGEGGTVSGSADLSALGPQGASITALAVSLTDPDSEFAVVASDGDFRFENLPPDDYSISIIADGFATSQRDVTVVEGDQIELSDVTLTALGQVSGAITSNLPETSVEYTDLNIFNAGELFAVTQAGADGSFLIQLPPGTFTIEWASATQDGYAKPVTVTVGEGATLRDIEMTIEPGASIGGTVTDGTGHPLAGVLVRATADGLSRSYYTGSNGEYLFTNLPAGNIQVSTVGETHTVTVTAVDDTTPIDQDFSLASVASISGVLTDTLGEPLAASILLFKDGEVVSQANSNADGEYIFHVTELGTYDLQVASRFGAFNAASGVAVDAGDEVTQNFVAGSSSLTLDVGDAGALVTLLRITSEGPIEAGGGITDETGQIVLENLHNGDYRYRILASNNQLATEDVTVSGDTSQPATLTPGAEFGGTIVDNTGEAVAGAIVLLYRSGESELQKRMVTGVEGNYRLGNVAPGDYDMVIVADGFASETISLTASGEVVVDATLIVADATLSGVVLDDAGQPVSVAGIEVFDADGRIVAVGETDAGGNFAVTTDAEAKLTVRIVSAGYEVTEVTGIDLTGGDVNIGGTALVDITLGNTIAPAEGLDAGGLDGNASIARVDSSVVSLLGGPSGSALTANRTGEEISQDINGPISVNISPDNLDPRGVTDSRLLLAIRDRFSLDLTVEGLEEFSPYPHLKSPSVDDLQQRSADCDCELRRLQALQDTLKRDIYIQDAIGLRELLREQNSQVGWVFMQSALDFADKIGKMYVTLQSVLALLPAAGGATAATGAAATTATVASGTANTFPILRGTVATLGGMGAGLLSAGLNIQAAIQAASAEEASAQVEGAALAIGDFLGTVGTVIAGLSDVLTQGGTSVLGTAGTVAGGLGSAISLLVDLQGTARGLSFGLLRSLLRDIVQTQRLFDDIVDNAMDFHTEAKLSFQKYEWCIDGLLRTEPCDNGTLEDKERNIKRLELLIQSPIAKDPNDIIGPEGFGEERFVPADQPLDYTIRFENDPEFAQAPAQRIRIENALDSDLDFRTFRLGDMQFSDTFVDVPDDAAFFQDRVSITVDVPVEGETDLLVDIFAGIDVTTGVAFWELVSVDSGTGDLPLNPLVGLLPVNTDAPLGEGFTTYSVRAEDGKPTGTRIDAQATIIFDINAPIDTPSIFNTLDASAPTANISLDNGVSGSGAPVPPASLSVAALLSTRTKLSVDSTEVKQFGPEPAFAEPERVTVAPLQVNGGFVLSPVAPLPSTNSVPAPIVAPGPSFEVTWGGTDDAAGSAIETFTVLVSEDGGPFTPWLEQTELTGATFTGEPGSTYRFIVLTQDNVGNRSALPPDPQLVVQVADDGGGGDDNTAPNVADAAFTVDENAASGTSVGTVSGSDSDVGDSITYAITGGNAGGAFAIDPSTGEITVADATLLDFETMPSFALTVEVTDNGGLTDDATVTLDLNDVNERPTVDGQTFNVDENASAGTSVGIVNATDPDALDSLTYTITGGNDSGAFGINPATGEISVADASLLDFETMPSFVLTVEAADTGLLTDVATVNIGLNDVNEGPRVDDQGFTLDENAPVGASVGTVAASDPDAGDSFTYTITAGNDAGAFDIDPTTGEITVVDSAPLDFETTPSFALTVQVSDLGGLSDDATVTIDLNDVNEKPTVGDETFTLDENATTGTSVGGVLGSDPDAGDALTYDILSGNGSGAFTINPTTGEITVAGAALLDFEATPSFGLTVEARDLAGLTSEASVNINLLDVNEKPTVDDAVFSLVEDATNGDHVGAVSASDPDAGDSPTYAITSGNTDGAFTINPSTGEITVANESALNAANDPFELTVEVTDDGALTDTAAVTITLENVNDPPTLDDTAFSVDENAGDDTPVGTVAASDPDAGESFTYVITAGNDAGAFAIDPTTGQITVADSTLLDFETTPSFALTVQVTDNGGLDDDATVTIDLNDVNEKPTVDDAGFTVDESANDGDVVGIVTGDDPDAADTLSYAITAGNIGGAFAIDPNTGRITVADASQLDAAAIPSYALTVQVTDAGGLTDEATVTVDVTGTVAQDVEVAGVTIGDGSGQRSNIDSITVEFTGPTNLADLIVSGDITDAVMLVNATTDAPISLETARYSYDAATNRLTVDLTQDGPGGSVQTMLADGRYELRLDAGAIRSATGDALLDTDGDDDGIHRYAFHRLGADFDGDAVVGAGDLSLLLNHYRTQVGDANYDPAFDLNDDGRIDTLDYMILRRQAFVRLP